jgi:predicted small metal-binding protein
MRVLECNICGETINAENDEELKARLRDHLGSEHDEAPSAEELDELVEGEAYEAMDS